MLSTAVGDRLPRFEHATTRSPGRDARVRPRRLGPSIRAAHRCAAPDRRTGKKLTALIEDFRQFDATFRD